MARVCDKLFPAFEFANPGQTRCIFFDLAMNTTTSGGAIATTTALVNGNGTDSHSTCYNFIIHEIPVGSYQVGNRWNDFLLDVSHHVIGGVYSQLSAASLVTYAVHVCPSTQTFSSCNDK